MEVRNIHGTLDSAKMGGESLEDVGTAKEPLPFLKRIILLDNLDGVRDHITFCSHVSSLGIKSEDFQGSNWRKRHVLYQNIATPVAYQKRP